MVRKSRIRINDSSIYRRLFRIHENHLKLNCISKQKDHITACSERKSLASCRLFAGQFAWFTLSLSLYVWCMCMCYPHLLCMSHVVHQNGTTANDSEPTTTTPTVEITTEENNGPKAEALISPKDLYKWLAKIEVFISGIFLHMLLFV